MQSKERFTHHEIPGILWKVVYADIFSLYIKNYLHIVDYHSKFPGIKKVEGLSVDNLILACEVIFQIWTTQENNVRCKWYFFFRKITRILKTTEHRTNSSSIIPPLKQWTGVRMHQIFKTNAPKVYRYQY